MKSTSIKPASLRPLLSIKADDDGALPSKLEVLQTGMWDAPYHGMFMIAPEDLQQYIQNFNADVRPSSSTKGLPIDLDHDAGAAAGWMTALSALPNDQGGWSLWADVTWTDLGQQVLTGGQYAFFSPEFCPEGYIDPEGEAEPLNNVLIGGGLTNRPLFKDLQPVMASDASGKSSGLKTSQFKKMFISAKEDVVPTLDEVRVKDPATLNTEEKQLLADHREELSQDERDKFSDALGSNSNENANNGDGADGAGAGEGEGSGSDGGEGEGAGEGDENTNSNTEAAPVAANDKNGKSVTISASELDSLQKAAAQGVSANEKLIRKEAEDHITSKAFNASDGFKFPQDLKADLVGLYVSASEDQKKTIDKLLDATTPIKSASDMDAKGSGSEFTEGSAYVALSEKTAEIMKANDKLDFTTAMLEARKQNPELADSYDKEYQAGKPQLASR